MFNLYKYKINGHWTGSKTGLKQRKGLLLNRLIFSFICLICIFLSGCRELVEVDLPNNNPQLVVEAEITDAPGPYSVRLTQTLEYFSDEELPPVEDAVVTIRDGAGNEEELFQVEPGLYITHDLQGVTGRTYTLNIEWNNNLYESSGILLEEAKIDTLIYRYFPANPPVLEEGYYVIAYGSLPKGRSNFFRFKVLENDSLYNGRSDIFVQSDEFLGDTDALSLRFPYPFDVNDEVRIEMYTLNEDMYQYYLELITLLFNDGGLFSPPPQNPVSNIRNLTNPDNPPLGYFQVASLTAGEITIEELQEE